MDTPNLRKTRAGSEVVVYEVVNGHIFGRWLGPDNEWFAARWNADGSLIPNRPTEFDLV